MGQFGKLLRTGIKWAHQGCSKIVIQLHVFHSLRCDAAAVRFAESSTSPMSQEREQKTQLELASKARSLDVDKQQKKIDNLEKELAAKSDEADVLNLRDIVQSTKNALQSKAASAGVGVLGPAARPKASSRLATIP